MKRVRVAIAMLAMAALLGACAKEKPMPLSLQVSSRPESLDEEIRLMLVNPQGTSIFIPLDGTGIEMYRKDGRDNWLEYKKHNDPVPMTGTKKTQIVYLIPGGTLAPGTYKFIIRGRFGESGAPFNLEAGLNMNLFSNTEKEGS